LAGKICILKTLQQTNLLLEGENRRVKHINEVFSWHSHCSMETSLLPDLLEKSVMNL
jgi:hypothetical protein